MGRKEWRKRFPGPTFFITGKDKGKLSYFWDHVYLKAKSGPNLGGVVNPDSGDGHSRLGDGEAHGARFHGQAEGLGDAGFPAVVARRASRRSGRRTGTAFSVWRRSNTSAAI